MQNFKSKSYQEPVYLISEVAKILEIHPQTLRQYEREGLVTPSRTNGKIRLYSQEDIDYIKDILHLTRTQGVNLAGVSVIQDLKTHIKKLEIKVQKYESQLNISTSQALVVKKSQYDIIVFEE
ncbi:MAG: MerR family transcriptional regulator [Campylobacterales bacterium]|nr:MerR family transcriptional regulator [Campylobacterales bacterium]